MKQPLSLALATALLLLSAAASPPLLAQEDSALLAENPIADADYPLGTKQAVIKLKEVFKYRDANVPTFEGSLVRFSTSQGDIVVELYDKDAPATVANFLRYVDRGAYDGTFIHRSVAGFIVQGGGFTYDGDPAAPTDTFPASFLTHHITQDAPVVNEFKISNTRGTLAMAKLGGDPNSATSEWFFNEADNSANLDSQNGGFTVFGHIVLDSLEVLDNIGARPVTQVAGRDRSSSSYTPLTDVPVVDYVSNAAVTDQNLVLVNSVARTPPPVGLVNPYPVLKYKVKGNTNPDLVKAATFAGKKLLLKLRRGALGSSTITVLAKDEFGAKATTSFTVTVQPPPPPG